MRILATIAILASLLTAQARLKTAIVAVAAVTAASTVADITLSRRCEAEFVQCREKNPMIPHNLAAAISVQAAVSTGLVFMARWSIRRGNKVIWATPALAVSGAHLLGAYQAARVMRELKH